MSGNPGLILVSFLQNHWYSQTKKRVSRAISPPASPGRIDDGAHSSTASPPRKRGRAEDDIDSDSE